MAKFSIPIARMAEQAKADLDTVARKVALSVFTSVVVRSPVDTGRFKSNWNVSHNAPDFGTTEGANEQRATTEVQKALSFPVGGVVWLANGLPYARRLEHGWSKQAPAGMVKITVQEFSLIVNKAAAQVRNA